MKLVFYGGGHDFENIVLDEELLSLTNCKSPQITFIPSCSYSAHIDFRDFVNQYSKFNINRFLNFPIDTYISPVLLREALQSDIIHLAGGNTFYFLKHLRKNKMLGELKRFVKNGGILTGLSAGAIMMTNNISTASFPEFDRDANDDNVKNYSALNLVDFEFFPHYKNSSRYDFELKKYSKEIANPLYACPDGSGIVVNREQLSFVNKVFCFYQGKKFKVNN